MDGFSSLCDEQPSSSPLSQDTLRSQTMFDDDFYFTNNSQKQQPLLYDGCIREDCSVERRPQKRRKQKKQEKISVYQRNPVIDLTDMVDIQDVNMDCVCWVFRRCNSKDLAVVSRVCTTFKKYAKKSLRATRSAFLSTAETARAYDSSKRIENLFMSKMTFQDFKLIQPVSIVITFFYFLRNICVFVVLFSSG